MTEPYEFSMIVAGRIMPFSSTEERAIDAYNTAVAYAKSFDARWVVLQADFSTTARTIRMWCVMRPTRSASPAKTFRDRAAAEMWALHHD